MTETNIAQCNKNLEERRIRNFINTKKNNIGIKPEGRNYIEFFHVVINHIPENLNNL